MDNNAFGIPKMGKKKEDMARAHAPKTMLEKATQAPTEEQNAQQAQIQQMQQSGQLG